MSYRNEVAESISGFVIGHLLSGSRWGDVCFMRNLIAPIHDDAETTLNVHGGHSHLVHCIGAKDRMIPAPRYGVALGADPHRG